MTEKRFEIVESSIIDGAKVIKDNEKKYTFPSTFETLFNYRKALNELDERYIAEFSLRETLQQELQRVEYENEQLKEERNYFERKKCEYFNKYNKKHLNNIQLKKENEQLKEENEEFNEELMEYDSFKRLYGEKIERLEKENEQLKKDVDYWKQVASQYSNELNVFEHFKKYKTECKDIHWSSD